MGQVWLAGSLAGSQMPTNLVAYISGVRTMKDDGVHVLEQEHAMPHGHPKSSDAREAKKNMRKVPPNDNHDGPTAMPLSPLELLLTKISLYKLILYFMLLYM